MNAMDILKVWFYLTTHEAQSCRNHPRYSLQIKCRWPWRHSCTTRSPNLSIKRVRDGGVPTLFETSWSCRYIEGAKNRLPKKRKKKDSFWYHFIFNDFSWIYTFFLGFLLSRRTFYHVRSGIRTFMHTTCRLTDTLGHTNSRVSGTNDLRRMIVCRAIVLKFLHLRHTWTYHTILKWTFYLPRDIWTNTRSLRMRMCAAYFCIRQCRYVGTEAWRVIWLPAKMTEQAYVVHIVNVQGPLARTNTTCLSRGDTVGG